MSGSDNVDSEVDKEIQMEDDTSMEAKLSESDPDEMVGLGSEEELFDLPLGMNGSLSKWTNYIHGWQERYFVLEVGLLSYFKSEMDTQYGCRGSITLHKTKTTVSHPSLHTYTHSYMLHAHSDHTCVGHGLGVPGALCKNMRACTVCKLRLILCMVT